MLFNIIKKIAWKICIPIILFLCSVNFYKCLKPSVSFRLVLEHHLRKLTSFYRCVLQGKGSILSQSSSWQQLKFKIWLVWYAGSTPMKGGNQSLSKEVWTIQYKYVRACVSYLFTIYNTVESFLCWGREGGGWRRQCSWIAIKI